jgi:alkylation response protein AidB-like acyl-CoA dehydrogenase
MDDPQKSPGALISRGRIAMDFALQPHTPAGARFVALAEQHAADFATRADLHDRDGSFPFENIEAMQRSGFMAGCVPVEFGGLGVESMHDMILGTGRLGRGDGSTAIAATSPLAGCKSHGHR